MKLNEIDNEDRFINDLKGTVSESLAIEILKEFLIDTKKLLIFTNPRTISQHMFMQLQKRGIEDILFFQGTPDGEDDIDNKNTQYIIITPVTPFKIWYANEKGEIQWELCIDVTQTGIKLINKDGKILARVMV